MWSKKRPTDAPRLLEIRIGVELDWKGNSKGEEK